MSRPSTSSRSNRPIAGPPVLSCMARSSLSHDQRGSGRACPHLSRSKGRLMALRYCPHCEQMVTARRQFGIGTLLLVLVTGGLWLLVLGCYLPRCPLCKSHFLGKDTAPDAPGGRRRPMPPAPTDYEGRLDALVHTRDHEKRWRSWRLWGLGAALSVPLVIGLVRLLPIQQKPPLPAPVPALTPEGKQRPASPAPAETPEAVRSPSHFVVMPGKLVG